MLLYKPKLKEPARNLRQNMTECELILWSHLRRKQIHGVQFYRQKPIHSFIVDFYAPKAKLVVEVDGQQHFEAEQLEKDRERTEVLKNLGLHVLRFNNLEVKSNVKGVVEVISQVVRKHLD